jgi:hypothetical protein
VNETCASCNADYHVTPENAGLVVFLGYLPASHVLATCPHCQVVTVIYTTPEALAGLANAAQGQFSIALRDQPAQDRRAAADTAWARYRSGQTQGGFEEDVEDLPEAPHTWVRQLHDDLREFGRLLP